MLFAHRVKGIRRDGHRWCVQTRNKDMLTDTVVANVLPQSLANMTAPQLNGALRDVESSVESGIPWGSGVRTVRPDWLFDVETAAEELTRRYGVQSLDGFGFEERDSLLIRAAGALVAYVEEIRPGASEHLRAPRIQRPGAVMALDSMTRRNLELVEALRPYDGDASLLSVLDDSATPMGARLLRSWVLHPLLDPESIWRR